MIKFIYFKSIGASYILINLTQMSLPYCNHSFLNITIVICFYDPGLVTFIQYSFIKWTDRQLPTYKSNCLNVLAYMYSGIVLEGSDLI